MSTTYATITVVRNDEPIEVELEGSVEYFGSHNPHERGQKIESWSIISPKDIKLTQDECDRAEYALDESI